MKQSWPLLNHPGPSGTSENQTISSRTIVVRLASLLSGSPNTTLDDDVTSVRDRAKQLALDGATCVFGSGQLLVSVLGPRA